MNKTRKLINMILEDRRNLYFLFQRRIKGQRKRNYAFCLERFFKPNPSFSTHNDNQDMQGYIEALDKNGITFFENIISAQDIKTLREHCENAPLRDPIKNKDKHFGLSNVPPDVHVAHVDMNSLLSMPLVMNIANHPALVECVSRKMGCKPLIDSVLAWWSFPGHENPEEAQNYHRDIDALSFYKLFIYLTDVDDKSGPHVYVKTSQSADKLTDIRRFHDQEVTDAYGEDKILHLTGKAGSCFMENTYGIHKGLVPTKKKRLIFQVIYASSPTPYGPKKPVLDYDEQYTSFDPYINKLIIRKPHARESN